MAYFDKPAFPLPDTSRITRMWISEGKKYWTDELALQSELNSSDSIIEHWFQIAESTYSASISFIKNLLKKSLGPMYSVLKGFGSMLTHLISAVLNFITNIMYLTTTKVDGALWYFSIASLIASFSSFLVSIKDMLGNLGYTFDSERAISCVKLIAPDLGEAVSSEVPQESSPERLIPNGLKSESIVKLAVGSIVAVLCAGLGIANNVDFKKLIMHADVLERAKKTTNTVSDITNFVLKEIIGNECDPDYAQCKLLEDLAHEGAELQNFTAAHFVQHPHDYWRLRQFSDKIGGGR